MNEAFNKERLASLHLRELTREGGEGLLLERLYIEVDNTAWSDDEKLKVMSLADDIVHLYHAGDKRDDNTYATHVLRVATRILSPDHFNVRDDPNIIIAALLHDVVEDHPERLLGVAAAAKDDIEGRIIERDAALRVIATMHGQEVADMVRNLSNPINDTSGVPGHERQQIYREHVAFLMKRGGKERLIKLSDFIDNCLGLAHNPSPKLRHKLAQKYYGLKDAMYDFVTTSDLGIAVKNDIFFDLDHAQQLCEMYAVQIPAIVESLGSKAINPFPPKISSPSSRSSAFYKASHIIDA